MESETEHQKEGPLLRNPHPILEWREGPAPRSSKSFTNEEWAHAPAILYASHKKHTMLRRFRRWKRYRFRHKDGEEVGETRRCLRA